MSPVRRQQLTHFVTESHKRIVRVSICKAMFLLANHSSLSGMPFITRGKLPITNSNSLSRNGVMVDILTVQA